MVAKADLDDALRQAQGDDADQAGTGKTGADPGGKSSQASQLAELINPDALFHDDGAECYARVPVGDHFETHGLQSAGFRRYIVGQYFLATGKAPSKESIGAAVLLLEAIATYQGACRNASVRVGEGEGAIYVDLGTPDWSVVEITQNGWTVRNDAPIALHRPPGLRPLPMPSSDGDIGLLRQFLNCDADHFVLAIAWLVGALAGTGPYWVLVLQGEHGSAKSSAARMLRSLVDPHTSPLRASPRNEMDFLVSARNSRVLAYDNLSVTPAWLSDAICRVATGGGFSARQLYTDSDEVLFSVQRPVIVNGIGGVVNAPDLADRALFLKLKPIPDGDRIPERELQKRFDQAAPLILGGLYDAVAEALRNLPSTRLPSLPRMADACLWVTAAEPALPWETGRFGALYGMNRANVVADTLESSPLGSAVMHWVRGLDSDQWEGKAADLLESLEDGQSDGTLAAKSWPKSASALSRKLSMLSTFLRRAGVDVDLEHRIGGDRAIKVTRAPDDGC